MGVATLPEGDCVCCTCVVGLVGLFELVDLCARVFMCIGLYM